MKRISIALVAFAAFAVPSAAYAQQTWTPQLYVGVHGGKALVDTKIDGDDAFAANGWTGGIHAGIDVPFAKPTGLTPFAGVFGGYDWSTVEANLGESKISFGDSWYLGGRIGVMTIAGSKYYVLGAYRDTAADWTELRNNLSSFQGWDVGLGASIPLNRYVEVGVEGIYTRYNEKTIGETKVQPNQLGIMARLNFALGDPRQPMIFEDDPPPCDPKMANCKKR